MTFKKSFKKVLIVVMTLLTALLVFGCSDKKAESTSGKVSIDEQTAEEIANDEFSRITKYLEVEKDNDYLLMEIKLLDNTPKGVQAPEYIKSDEVNVTSPVYEAWFEDSTSLDDVELYFDASSGDFLGIRREQRGV